MVGAAVVRALRARGYSNLILTSRSETDLTDSVAVKRLFKAEKPEVVVLAAARVGGIQANIADPTGFLYDNLMIQNNVIKESFKHGVEHFCFLGSSCIYPRECPQPMKEEYLLTGPLEPTNEGYAIAKIAGLRLLEYYRRQYGFLGYTLVPCNLYGTNDSFDPQNSHVLSALVRKIVDAVDAGGREVTMWGTGSARREFMHVDDCAAAVQFFLDAPPTESFLNVGCGDDVSIKQLAERIADIGGFRGEMRWDASKPDGMPRKCVDVTRLREYGFRPTVTLDEGITQTIAEYRQHLQHQATAPR
jgi:GDP-L-fucose synthase